MKIALLIISEQVSGAEHVVAELASRLGEHDDVTLICNRDLQKYYSTISNCTVTVLPYHLQGTSPLKRCWIYWRCAQRFRRLCREKHFDVLNINLLSSILISKLAWLPAYLPLVITLHGMEIKKYAENCSLFYRMTIRPLFAAMLIRAQRVITISAWQRQMLQKVYSYPERICQIPNGVDVQVFHPSPSPKKPAVLFVGRLIPEKGVQEILAVAECLPKVDFLFVGSGPLADKIVGKNVKSLGYISHRKMTALYRKISVGVFPSYHEPFGLVGLEAMAAGKPIICTPKGFDEYAVDGQNSLFVQPGDALGLQRAIEKLISDKVLYRRLAKNARRTAQQYDWRKVALQYTQVFQSAISKE
jgi:glycosyltransferase involved in cell wall biosynthesis